ncbi:hypothetical protein L9W92_10180 [Pelotomaculum terephthalicicum JT]|uniref:ABC-three component system protein n=1 Tax=Pelotomaculum terephthalicicum TaxID=206393 RepID=UPI001F04E3E4|nr:ABC-three component system protein [Pelotomaculum terephthalicicum]MCG9968420.1 hypothetical protein [Pelotomaculum terephthalicicum JT]
METRNKHSAYGQALGYIYQFDRATYRLLSSSISVVAVGIEHVDDVSVHFEDGQTIREQDKLTTVAKYSPLSDKSIALWKTLHIWAEEFGANPSLMDITEFHLITNGKVSDESIASRLGRATEMEDCIKIAEELTSKANNLRENLAGYGKTISNLSIESLARIISRIFVFDNVSPKFGGDLAAIQSLRYFSDIEKISIFDQACGWVKRKIMYLVENNLPLTIIKEDFDREVRALIRRIKVAPLTSLIVSPVLDPNLQDFEVAGFVEQLDWIESDETLIREAIIHYIQARDTRIKWTDGDVVSEESLDMYFEDLISRWRRVQRQTARRSWATLEIQGQECLDATLSEDTILDGEPMPKAISCGNFHVLADFTPNKQPTIGWHPKFMELASKKKR